MRYHSSHCPLLLPPSSRIAERSGSKANSYAQRTIFGRPQLLHVRVPGRRNRVYERTPERRTAVLKHEHCRRNRFLLLRRDGCPPLVELFRLLDVVLAEVHASLHFDEREEVYAGVLEPMRRLNRDVY